MTSLMHSGVQAVRWSFFTEITSKAIGPVILLVLARVLTPEDFGVVAAATVVISFSLVLSEAGLSKALIQNQDNTDESANIVFFTNLALGLVVFVALILLAPVVAVFFHDERITAVVRVLSVQVLLVAVSSVHTALLQKSLRFKRLFWVRLVTTGLPGLISIPLALNGWGYWALVAGTLVGQAAQSVILWRQSDWRPTWAMDRDLAKKLVAFGKWAMFSGLLGWFFLWMDSIVVGHYLSSTDLGVYHVGNTLVAMVMGLVAGSVIPVLYSVLSKQQNDFDALRSSILTTAKAVAVLIAPMALGLLLISDSVADLVFDQEWAGIAGVIAILAITQAIAYSVTVMQEGYRSIGRPDVETKVMSISMAIRVPFYLIAVQFGLMAFVVARLAATCLGVVNHLIFAHRTLKVSVRDYLGTVRVAGIAALVMLGIGWFILRPLTEEQSSLTRVLVVVPICVVVYLAVLWITDRDFVKRLYAMNRTRTAVGATDV